MAGILIIEDSRSQQVLITRFLEQSGHEVTAVADGRDGLSAAKQEDNRFDLVVTDIVLPSMDGIQLIQQIRKFCKFPIGIIAMSGGSQNSVMTNLETAKIAGADAVLAKPFKKQQLTEKVQQVLSKK